MGLRGPGAKPVKRKAATPAAKGRPKRHPWQRPGLSRAARVIAFIESLPITAGAHAGRKMKLRPWQRREIEQVYRTDRKGLRIVRTWLFTLPRKNGKTALAAALALCHLCGPEAEARGQVYSAAADKYQAALLYNEMRAIIDATPWMQERVIVRDFNKHLEDAETGSIYLALSADAKTKHGFSASFIIYDELAQAPNRELYDVLTTSTAARAEPLAVVISTQNADPLHVMSELVDYGRKVLDGAIDDPSFHATIYSAPMEADPWDEATWRACNPALGDFRSLEEMRTSAKQAQRIPARESAFRLLYLNQPVEADDRFIHAADWLACKREIDRQRLAGKRCWAGLDLSSTRDLSALVLYFPDDGGAILPFFWCPADELDKREDIDRVPYRTWARAGLIEPTPGRSINKTAIALRLAEVAQTYRLQAVAYDRWSIEELRRIMADEGIRLPLVEHGQGYKDFSPALSALESAILDRRISHDGNPILTWNLANAVVDTDPAGNRKLAKERARERIDGLVAMAMALGIHAKEPAAPPPAELRVEVFSL
jgi:phage terminase large subunit-like protein